jgi:hypothetical protein
MKTYYVKSEEKTEYVRILISRNRNQLVLNGGSYGQSSRDVVPNPAAGLTLLRRHVHPSRNKSSIIPGAGAWTDTPNTDGQRDHHPERTDQSWQGSEGSCSHPAGIDHDQ